MKFLGLIAIGTLAVSAAAFNLPQAQQGGTRPSNLDQPTRRTFFQSAGAAIAATVLAPSKSNAVDVGGKVVYGDESIMSQKTHGTSEKPVQNELLYGVSNKLADKISNYNRQFAEFAGYFRSTSFEDVVLEAKGPVTFYDSVTGKPLFVAPIGRSAEQFVQESEVHGWPSFRDEEVSDAPFSESESILCLTA